MNSLITKKPIDNDDKQNLRFAYHLKNYGVFALILDDSGIPIPSDYREPFPPVVTAAFMAVHPTIPSDASLKSLAEGVNTKKIKQVNLIWIMLLLVGIGLLTYAVSKNIFLPFLTIFLVFMYFIRFGGQFNTLFTELPAAVLIIWASFFLQQCVSKHSTKMFFLAGLFLGLLILTKAVFFYIFIFIAILIFLISTSQKKLTQVSLMTGTVFLVITPWLIRNSVVLDDFGISGRGGIVLYQRTLLDGMSNEEIKGAVYLWGPELYRDLVAGTQLDVDENDFSLGGKYQKLVRFLEIDKKAREYGLSDRTVNYLATTFAEYERLSEIHYQKELDNHAGKSSASDIMKDEAVNWILDNPGTHIMMSGLFFWRSIWCFPNSTLPFVGHAFQTYFHNFFNFISFVSLFALFFVGLIKKNANLIAVCVIPVSLLSFQILFAHCIPRYSQPAIPSMMVSISIIAFHSKIEFQKWVTTYRNNKI